MSAFGAGDEHLDDSGTRIMPTLARLDERLIALGREVERNEAAGQRALELATKETERRLHILNGAHEEAKCTRATYYSREMHDQFATAVDKRITSLERAVWMAVGAGAVAGTAAAIIVRVLHL
jgi:hypothetical protein